MTSQVSQQSSTVPDVQVTAQVSLVLTGKNGTTTNRLFCAAFVDQNPKAFENAFWDFAAVRVYT